MSDDRESGCEAAARIRVRGLRHTNSYGDGDGQTRLAGYARWCDAETRISRLSHIHGCGSEGGHV
jgi:hypothetical protein